MTILFYPRKLEMFCDNCQKVTRHKKLVMPRYYYKCMVCKEETRRVNKSKDGWVDRQRARRKSEEKQLIRQKEIMSKKQEKLDKRFGEYLKKEL